MSIARTIDVDTGPPGFTTRRISLSATSASDFLQHRHTVGVIDAVFRKRQLLGVANFKAQAVGQPLLSRNTPSLAQQVGVEIDAHDLD